MLSPVTLLGKNIYRDICDLKLSWDQPLSGDILKRWNLFCTKMAEVNVMFPRSLVLYREPIQFVDFHVFADASKIGTAAVLYVVVHQ